MSSFKSLNILPYQHKNVTAAFRALNEQGREEAVKRVQELAELKRYRK